MTQAEFEALKPGDYVHIPESLRGADWVVPSMRQYIGTSAKVTEVDPDLGTLEVGGFSWHWEHLEVVSSPHISPYELTATNGSVLSIYECATGVTHLVSIRPSSHIRYNDYEIRIDNYCLPFTEELVSHIVSILSTSSPISKELSCLRT